MGKRKKLPAYNAEDAALLKSAGINHRVKQPFGTIKAVRAVQPEQRSRITYVSTQERVVKDSDGRIDTCRAAMVQQVHPAIGLLTPRSQNAWLEYAELWDAAQPNMSMNYGERVTGNKSTLRDENRDPAWLDAAKALREFHKAAGPQVKRHADEFMRTKGILSVQGIDKVLLENVGIVLADTFESL